MRILHCSDRNFHYRGGDNRLTKRGPICGGSSFASCRFVYILPPQSFVRLLEDKEYLYEYMYYAGDAHICESCSKHEDIPFLLLEALDE